MTGRVNATSAYDTIVRLPGRRKPLFQDVPLELTGAIGSDHVLDVGDRVRPDWSATFSNALKVDIMLVEWEASCSRRDRFCMTTIHDIVGDRLKSFASKELVQCANVDRG